MEDFSNMNREMAQALRALALAGPKPVGEYVNVSAALAKLGIACRRGAASLYIEGRDALALADYIDRPVGDADVAQPPRKGRAMIFWGDTACLTSATSPRLSAWT